MTFASSSVNGAASPLCPIDAVEKGKFKIQSSDKAGDNGIRFQLSLKGATKDGLEVNLSTIRIEIALEVGATPCSFYQASPLSELIDGRLKGNRKFTGADTSPAIPMAASGTSVTLCGPILLSFGLFNLAIDGMNLGGP